MEILKILTESAKELYPEDLDFFETELATGGIYNAAYQAQCRSKIKELRAWMNGEITEETEAESTEEDHSETQTEPEKPAVSKGIVVGIQNLAPAASNPVAATMTPAQQIESDVKAMREQSSYKTVFKKYVKDSTVIDADFLEAHFSFFQQWEMDAIVSVKQLGEEFLEKYFGALDHDKIARYQLFSESFFMKHFSQMDPGIVLEHGKNEWRKKENRSKQLDVFLRLKGVKI